jgi:hypothetical protein
VQSWQTAVGWCVSTPDLSFCQAKSTIRVQQWEKMMPEDTAIRHGPAHRKFFSRGALRSWPPTGRGRRTKAGGRRL